ncbi:MAG: thiamine phosphate synthase [Candidatus Diapherotrites archaeon]|nr:thiamine phosphate synthase [Candidatus Micrarchaeota archaeon]
MLPFDFYFITDSKLSRQDNVADVRSALSAGAKIIQYRVKGTLGKKVLAEAQEIKQLCDETNAMLIINDSIELCLAVNASGVHLGQDDLPLAVARKLLPDKVIGITVHNIPEAETAEKEGADYLGVSPIFSTSTKDDAGTPCGIALLQELKQVTSLPLVAIGGITPENIGEVLESGAYGVAAISATVATNNVESAVRQFREKITGMRK